MTRLIRTELLKLTTMRLTYGLPPLLPPSPPCSPSWRTTRRGPAAPACPPSPPPTGCGP